MADTTYTAGTVVASTWLNDVNTTVYRPTTAPVSSGFLASLFGRSTGEIAASVTPTNYSYFVGDIRRYGATINGSTNDITPINNAILSMGTTGAGGGVVSFPIGTTAVQSTITQPNRVRFRGANVRASVIKAVSTFTGSYLVNAVNGTSSMFDAGLEDIYLDCNDIAGLGGILSDAWQENSGLNRVLVNKFRTYGVRYSNGYGGASSHVIANAEIFGSASGATAGIRVDQISSVGGFKLTVRDSTIAGGGALSSSLPRGIDFVNDSSFISNVHFEVCQTGIYLDGVGDHTIVCCDGAGSSSIVDTLVTIASTFTGSLTMIGCKRNGATNFLVDNRTNGLGTITGYDIPHLTIAKGTNAPLRSETAIRSSNTAAAWCVFDGTGAGPFTPNASYNVTNITDNGVGNYTINLTRAMSSVYAVGVGSTNQADSTVRVDLVGTTTIQVRVYVAGVLTDSNEVKVVIFGN